MALREVLASFGFQVDQKAIADADTGVKRLTSSLGSIRDVLGGAALALGIREVFSFAAESATALDTLDKFGAQVGINAREVAQWDLALQDAGLGLEEARSGLRDATKNIGESIRAGGDLATTLRRDLGVQLRDSSGEFRDQNELLTDATLGLANVENAAKRAAIAEQLFGGAAGGFIRVAEAGTDALQAQREEFDKLNPDFEQQIENAKEAAAALDAYRKSTQAARNRVAGALLPIFTRLVTVFDRVVRVVLELTEGTGAIEIALIGLAATAAVAAGAILVAFAPVLLPILAIAAAITAVILVAEDLFQLFSGGESVIASLIDELLGVGAAEKIVEDLRDAWDAVFPLLERLGRLLARIFPLWLRWLRLVARAWITVWRGIFDAAGFIVSGVQTVFQGIRDAWSDVVEFVRTAWDATFGVVVATIEAAVARIRRFIDLASDAAGAVADVLGFGGPEALPSLTLEELGATSRSALTRTQVPRESARVDIGPTTINVTGTADPQETARRVVTEMDRREQDRLRRIADRLQGRT